MAQDQPENGFQQARFELLREEHVRCTCTVPAVHVRFGAIYNILYYIILYDMILY